MDPYLEQYWGDVHHSLIQYARDALQPGLPPDLRARVEERVFLETEPGLGRRIVPDLHIARVSRPTASVRASREGGGTAVAEPEVVCEVLEEPITEGYLEIRERRGGRVITVVEFLSPANKMGGIGQQKYLEKQEQVLHSDASLVEIDLVRAGQRVLAIPSDQVPEADQNECLACVSPGWQRNRRELYILRLRQRLPVLPIPLRQGEQALPLDLQSLVDQAYAAGRYEDTDYQRELEPKLTPEQSAWAAELLKKAGLRSA
jgi:hypothetical protein